MKDLSIVEDNLRSIASIEVQWRREIRRYFLVYMCVFVVWSSFVCIWIEEEILRVNDCLTDLAEIA